MDMNKSNIQHLIEGAQVVIVGPDARPDLDPQEQELADMLISLTQKYGKFDQEGDGVWAGYKPPKENPKKGIGVKCANCVLYEGGSSCKIIALPVAPEGKCRFAVIPNGIVKKRKSK